MSDPKHDRATEGIAVIGMSGRFPGASDLGKFWSNLSTGVESITFASRRELLEAGVEASVIDDPRFVPAHGRLENFDLFDAAFFGYGPREAELMDPQHRVFLECAWEALEQAGYDAESYDGSVGMFAGMGMSTYLVRNLLSRPDLVRTAGALQLRLLNDKDFLVSQVAYRLGLTGPCVSVQTACSTSLVACCLACQSLLGYQCDIAMAGGVTIAVPQVDGYFAQENFLSPDGHCRAFDAGAQGTVEGSGSGVVVLKRLEDAVADGDEIHAVIRGFAMNNDGSQKVGYTAPSVEAQMEVVAMALAVADVEPESITLIEAHGTGTPLGDPIEVEALNEVFSARTRKKGFCALGSVKSNVGHLDAAAGIAGLLKTILSLKHGVIPPSLHFETPNPQIDLANSSFYVPTEPREWRPRNGSPRRAGVSSFSMGGTNAHLVVEEGLDREASSPSRSLQLLLLSAKTSGALERATDRLAHDLESVPYRRLADVAFTLQAGRRLFPHRRALVCDSIADAVSALKDRHPERLPTRLSETFDPPVVFTFPGQGSQYPGMGGGIYDSEPTFRRDVDQCCEMLAPHVGLDLRELLRSPADERGAAERLLQTRFAQPALFVVEYALARLWMEWGVTPEAMIGHSVGEYVAACLSGVLTLESALELIALRGRLMQEMPPGGMLSVPLAEEEVEALLDDRLSLAAVNAPDLSVVSGPVNAISALAGLLSERGVAVRRLHTSHAFHSVMMEPVVETFRAAVARLELRAPQIPYLSNVTGTWMAPQDATDPSYWARHLVQTVRFSGSLGVLSAAPERVFLEVGPGRTLSRLVRRHGADRGVTVTSLPNGKERRCDLEVLLTGVGRVRMAGVSLDWRAFYRHERRHRVPLPPYPFERARYWIEPGSPVAAGHEVMSEERRIEEWGYRPVWINGKLSPSREYRSVEGSWLIFRDDGSWGSAVAEEIRRREGSVVFVRPGPGFSRSEDSGYRVDPRSVADYGELLDELAADGQKPRGILHMWSLTPGGAQRSPETEMELGLFCLLSLGQALATRPGLGDAESPVELLVVANHLQDVLGAEAVVPERGALSGLVRVMNQELSHVRCRNLDLGSVEPTPSASEATALFAEVGLDESEAHVAYREQHRWARILEPTPLEAGSSVPTLLEERGVYMITGGLGGLGLESARALAEAVPVRLVLLGRSPGPEGDRTDSISESEAQRRRKIAEIEALGSEVLHVQADVTDRTQVAKAVAKAEARFGPIQGVIHAAGVPGSTLIQTWTVDGATRVLDPKWKGTRVLIDVFRDASLDFLMLYSSLSTLLGGLGLADYCSANAYLDAVAESRPLGSRTAVISVNWDAWRDVGAADRAGSAPNSAEWLRKGIRPSEGREILRRMLDQPSVRWVVTPRYLSRRDLRPWGSPIEPTVNRSSGAHHPRPDLDTAYEAPRNEREERLAEIFQEVLGISPVGVHDDFFELGGHSLLAVQTVTLLRERLGVDDLPIDVFLEHPTVARVTEALGDGAGASKVPKPPPINRMGPDEAVALSLDQQRLWFLQQFDPNSAALNIPSAVRIEGRLDVETLRRAMEEVVRRHEVLRTSFHSVGGKPELVIHPPEEFPLPRVDLTRLAEQSHEEAMNLTALDARRPIALHRCPLLRAMLLDLGQSSYILQFVMHHIVADAESIRIFVDEVTKLYRAFSSGRPSPLSELPIQYRDYGAWQRSWLRGEILETFLGYWRRHLAGDPPLLLLPTDRPRPAVLSSHGRKYAFSISKDLCADLRVLCRNEGVTLFVSLMAVYVLLLSRYSRQEDVVIGADVSNRNSPETKQLIGFFINMLVLRTDLSGEPSFRELLQRVKVAVLGGFAHRELPYESLVEALRPDRGARGGALFQVIFNFTHGTGDGGDESLLSRDLGLRIKPVEEDYRMARFELMLVMAETPSGLSGEWVFSSEIFDQATIGRMHGHFETLLRSVSKNPEASLRELEMYSPGEKEDRTASREARNDDQRRKLLGMKHKLVSARQKTLERNA